jgi:TRAP-type C4-dicarboxylate transport system permease small subunit
MSDQRSLPTRVLEYCAAALLAAMCILVCVQVFYRYVLEAPLTWSEELIRFLFVWLSFLGATICFRRGGHFRLDFFVRGLFPPHIARQILVVVDLIVLAFVVLLTVQGFALLKMAFLNHYVAIDMSAGWSYLAIPVCCGLMIPYIITDLWKVLRRVS